MPTNYPSYSAQIKGIVGATALQRGCIYAMGCSLSLFFGFLQTKKVVVPSDLGYVLEVHLRFQKVKMDNRHSPQLWLEINVKASNMDPFHQGVHIYVRTTGKWLCPVAAVLDYMYMVQHRNKAGPVFLFKDRR